MSIKPGNESQLRLEAAKTSLQQMQDRRTRLAVQLETAQAQWAEAVKHAEATYGTANLAELQALLQRQEAENAKALELFEQAVVQFGGQLARIEDQLANPAWMQATAVIPPAVPAVAVPVAALSEDI